MYATYQPEMNKYHDADVDIVAIIVVAVVVVVVVYNHGQL